MVSGRIDRTPPEKFHSRECLSTCMRAPQRGQCQVEGLSDWCCEGGLYGSGGARRQQLPAQRQVGGAKAIGEKAEVTNADEALRQDVQEESAKELVAASVISLVCRRVRSPSSES